MFALRLLFFLLCILLAEGAERKKKFEMAIKHIRQAKKGSHIGTMDEETYNFGISFVSDIDDTLREIRTRHYDN